MRPRHLLAVALVVLLPALAGCSPAGSLSMDPVDDAELADHASVPAPGEGSRERPPDAGLNREATMIQEAIVNGSATISARRPPVDQDRPFRSDGRFYELSQESVGSERGYQVGIEIDYNTSTVAGTVVDYDDLPAIDRRAMRPLLDRPRRARQDGFDFGLGATYNESEAAGSVLAPDQQYEGVRYDGEVYRIGVDADEVTLTVYRYTATLVADSPESFASQLRERYAFELTGLSDDERAIVEEARNDSYYAEDEDDEAFDALVDRFRDHPPVRSDEYGGSWIVRDGGQLYWAQLDYGAFVDDDQSVTPPSVTPPPDG
jgi:hypothetical protein